MYDIAMVTFSLCMIVKNEEAVLDRCLSSLSALMDEIIIVDTGSEDATKEIARQYTDDVYDFRWTQDFSEARNFAFSKATMDYIYSADADEMLDELNQSRLRTLKEMLLPEVEVVQMKYVTPPDLNTVLNAKKEYRPKLFKRLRTFTWIDPIHETVRMLPVVFDSDVEILHLPQDRHEKRDFHYFQLSFDRYGSLSDTMLAMYAQELFLSGKSQDFLNAAPIFEQAFRAGKDGTLRRKIACVLVRVYRLQKNYDDFLALTLMDTLNTPCAEICCEIGEYFFRAQNYLMASEWFYNAAYETEAILDVHASGDRPLYRLSDCYSYLAAEAGEGIFIHEALQIDYKEKATACLAAAESWSIPEENL